MLIMLFKNGTFKDNGTFRVTQYDKKFKIDSYLKFICIQLVIKPSLWIVTFQMVYNTGSY